MMMLRWTLLAGLLVTSWLGVAATPLRGQDDDEKRALAIADTALNSQNEGAYDFAAQEWQRLIEKYPKSSLVPKAQFNAGTCFLQLGKYPQARQAFEAALPKLEDPDVQVPQALLYLGFAQLEEGRALQAQDPSQGKELLTAATETFAKLLTDHPKFADVDQACYFQGGAWEALGQPENALQAYQRMFEFPQQTFKFDGWYAIADLQDQLGQFAAARETFDKFRQAASDGHPLLDEVNLRTAKTTISLALDAQKQGDADAARQRYTEANEILATLTAQDPSGKDDSFPTLLQEANYQRAYCARQLEDFGKAAELYQALAETPNSPYADQALAYAGRSLLDAGQKQQAEKLLEASAASDSPYGLESAHLLAGLWLEQQKFTEVLQLIEPLTGRTEEAALAVPLLLDQADATYGIPERRKESIALFDAIVAKYPTHDLAPAALYNSAFASLETGDLKTAISTADRLLQDFPQSDYRTDTLEVRADALLLDGQHVAASQAFEALAADPALAEHPKRSMWRLRAGLAQFLEQKYDAVIEQLTPLLEEKLEPAQQAEALHWIGSAQYQLKKYPEAEAMLQRSLAADNSWRRADETLLALCRSQLANGQGDAAAQTAKDLLQRFPQSLVLSDLHYQLGNHDYQAQRYAEALQHFETVLQDHPQSNQVPLALYSSAWCQLELEKLDQAEAAFTRFIEQFPQQPLVQEAQLARASIRRRMGGAESSLEELQKLLDGELDASQRINTLLEIGLAQVALKKWPAAVKTFESLLERAPEDARKDRFLYELAWACKEQDDPAAYQHFGRLASETPESSFAPEANFHLGNQAYDQQQYTEAVTAFGKCLNSQADANIREKAAYKRAWAYYKQDQFAEAAEAFTQQTTTFPEGALLADGLFMIAESLFRQEDYEAALAAYQKAQPAMAAATGIDEKLPWLTMLHGAQAANKAKQYQAALDLAGPIEDSQASESLKQDVYLELGSAYQGLKKRDEALQYWTRASESLTKTGARAHCLIGDLYFAEKKFDQATDEFKRVFFGFGGKSAPEDIQPWQAYARYEAARCNFVQVRDAPAAERGKLIAAAIGHFEALLETYPEDSLAPEARRQLEALRKLESQTP